MKRAYIKLTDSQRNELHPIFLECLNQGGSIMAQVFTDGIHVAVLPDEIALRVSEITGAAYSPKLSSGFKAFSDGIERDKKSGAS